MLETERFLIRAIAAEDAPSVFAYRSDAITNQYQGWIPKQLSEVDEFIAKNPKDINQPDTWFQLVIIDQENKELVGDIGIHFIDEQQVEIGCTLNKASHHKGVATESLRKVIDYLFKQLNKHRIIGSIDPDNAPSISLVERLGFRKEAHFKESLFIDGQWVDDIVYAILNREWNRELNDDLNP